MEMFLAIVSVILGVAGIAYGWYQNRLKEKIQRLSRMQAWEVYKSSSQVLGWLHNAFNETIPQQQMATFSDARARADSHYTKTIYNLYTHYDKVTPELIKKWIEEGRIDKEHEKDFLSYIGE